MAQVSIAEAARLTGKNRRTIERHLECGKLSFSVSVAGLRQIETSELARVYGNLSKTVAPPVNDTCQTGPQSVAAPDATDLALRLAVLEAENKLLRERIEDKDRHIAHIIGLLEHKSATQPQQPPRWKFWK